jgi:outer membrane lipoprotein-sorting protein
MIPTRQIPASIFLAATLILTQTPAHAQPANLQQVLQQMDAASTHFRSAQADFQWDLYERVVQQTTTQNGSIYFEKIGAKTQMGAKPLPPYTKFLQYKDGVLDVFDPGPDHLTVVHAAQYESFLTLGFGSSGADLAKAWTITDLGTESLNDGSGPIETTKLDLVPKDPKVLDSIAHVTIWVDLKRDISLKQQFFLPSEDQKTAIYTHIRYNQKVDAAPYAIKADKKTTIDTH